MLKVSTPILSDEVQLVYWDSPPLFEMTWSCKCFPHMSKLSALIYNRANNVVIKNDRTWNKIFKKNI